MKMVVKKPNALFSLFFLFFPYFFLSFASLSIPYGKKGVETRSFYGKFFFQLKRMKKILKWNEREGEKKGEKREREKKKERRERI